MSSAQHSPPRGVKRRYLFALAALVAALVVAVPLAWASHGFTDVPDANPFHTEISNLAGSGITAGKTCVPPGTPPTFCPNEPVVRQSMAAFMNRGLGRVDFGGTSLFPLPVDGNSIVIATITLNIGGAPGGTQFVKLDAPVATVIASAVGCPCTSGYWIHAVDLDETTFLHRNMNFGMGPDFGGGLVGEVFGAISAVATVPSGTTQTFTVRATRPAGSTGSVFAYADLTAITAPFGSTGGSTLGLGQAGLSLKASSTPPPSPGS